MTARPILFSGPMVRALLDGRKSQTRRVLTPPRGFVDADDPNHWDVSYWNSEGIHFVCWPRDEAVLRKVPHRYAIGDRLWLREAWRSDLSIENLPPRNIPKGSPIEYRAGGFSDLRGKSVHFGGRWRQGMHMPRWASRLTLTVTDVQVQRLQDISESDAVSEGCFKGKASGRVFESEASMHFGGEQWCNAREWYADLWDRLNADRGFEWDADPWIVAVSFTVQRRNIDEAA